MIRPACLTLVLGLGLGLAAMTATAQPAPGDQVRLRVASFNASLFGTEAGELAGRLRGRQDEQIRRVAAVIQAVRPDILLINEFDYDGTGRAAQDFMFNYLMRRQFGLDAIRYRYHHVAPVNTGVASPFDLNRDGQQGGPGDAWGFGAFPGQYGMLVLSRYPIDRGRLRSFRLFKWKDMPDALLPVHPSGHPWYSDTMLRWLPLASKSIWDVPIWTPAGHLHLIASHPTPPVFDGEEGRNSRRNHDEIRFLADYISGEPERAAYIYDDDGRSGGLGAGDRFVVAGDLNADPSDGASFPGAIDQLLAHARIQATPVPSSAGGPESAHRLGGSNLAHRGDPAHDTAVFGDPPGNLRVDYVLPSTDVRLLDAGVYWPVSDDTGAYLLDASDHRLVWVDVGIEMPPEQTRRMPRAGRHR